MKKIAILCDSSVSLTTEQVNELDVHIAPLIITNNNVSYIDGVDITNVELNNMLRNNEDVTTSQPSIGATIEILQDLKTQNFDHIFILSIGTALSGAYSSFVHAVNEVGQENITLINTYSITGPVQQGVRAIRKMNEDGKSIEEITAALNNIFDNQISYLYPKTLTQVIKSGRVSRASATVASLLKVRVLLALENKAEAIEKLAIARSNKKIFEAIVSDFKKHLVAPETHDIYLLESEGMDTLLEFKEFLFDSLGEFKHFFVNLPAAVATHGGLGCIAVQWCPKI